MSSQRTHTIAFRLTPPEHERIDDLARGEGISTSEFARRAVFGGLNSSTSAMEEATERGRDELRPQIAGLEGELNRMRSLLAKSRASERVLYKRLTQAPDELTAAAQKLVVGTPGCQVILATCWSRMDSHDRCKAIPLIATIVAANVDRVIATLRLNDADCESVGELVGRLQWLMEALTPDSGRAFASAGQMRRPEWAPLEASLRRADEWLLRCRKAIHQREAEALVTDVGETSTAEPNEATGAEGAGSITTGLREAIATTVREAVTSQARQPIAIEPDRMRAAEYLATMVIELGKAIATEGDPTRPTEADGTTATENSAAAATELGATGATEVCPATAPEVGEAGNARLPTLAKLGVMNQPAVVRVPLGVITGGARPVRSPDGYIDAAGRPHRWPSMPGTAGPPSSPIRPSGVWTDAGSSTT